MGGGDAKPLSRRPCAARPGRRGLEAAVKAGALSCLLLLSLSLACAPQPGARAEGLPGDPSGAGGAAAPAMPPIAAQLRELAEGCCGSYGIYLNVLEAGEQAGYREDEAFYAASLYKLYLVMYVYEGAARGEVDLDRTVTCQAGDMEGEEGVIQDGCVGTAFTTRELCRYAIVYSDNVAARMLKRVYGYRAFRDYARSIGCPVAGTCNINSTTAREMGILLMRVLQFAQTDPLGQEVVAFLEESTFKSRIPAGLPPGVVAGNKTGDYQGCMNDAAIVFLGDLTYVLCVLSRNGAGDRVHAEVSRLVYEDIRRRHYREGATSRSLQPARQWFFAHASTAGSFETWLRLSNADRSTAIAFVRCAGTGEGAERRVCVPAKSTVSLRVNQLFGMDRDLALEVACDIPILADRAAYYTRGGSWALESSRAGAGAAAAEWYVAGGRASQGMEAWLYLYNPGEAEAHPTVTAMAAGGRCARSPAVVPARGKASLCLNDLAGSPDAAVCVLSGAPLVVEEAAYLKQAGARGPGNAVPGMVSCRL